MSHRCPFCCSEPGHACRAHRGRGDELKYPHSRRIQLTSPPAPPLPRVGALCCECGNLRTVSANYHFSRDDENLAEGGGCAGFAGDPRGWRHTGTLLCRACGRRTRHALLRGDRFADYDEAYQRYALGGQWPDKSAPNREWVRERYFKQFPRNPKLRHWFSRTAAADALARGETHMQAKCGETDTIPRGWANKSAKEELECPGRIDWDTEFEDADTGLWWVDMDCVNCLRVVNEGRAQRARDNLARLISWYFVRAHLLTDAEVDELRTFLQATADRTFRRWQAERQH